MGSGVAKICRISGVLTRTAGGNRAHRNVAFADVTVFAGEFLDPAQSGR